MPRGAPGGEPPSSGLSSPEANRCPRRGRGRSRHDRRKAPEHVAESRRIEGGVVVAAKPLPDTAPNAAWVAHVGLLTLCYPSHLRLRDAGVRVQGATPTKP